MSKLRAAQIKKIHNFILYYIIQIYDVNPLQIIIYPIVTK